MSSPARPASPADRLRGSDERRASTTLEAGRAASCLEFEAAASALAEARSCATGDRESPLKNSVTCHPRFAWRPTRSVGLVRSSSHLPAIDAGQREFFAQNANLRIFEQNFASTLRIASRQVRIESRSNVKECNKQQQGVYSISLIKIQMKSARQRPWRTRSQQEFNPNEALA